MIKQSPRYGLGTLPRHTDTVTASCGVSYKWEETDKKEVSDKVNTCCATRHRNQVGVKVVPCSGLADQTRNTVGCVRQAE
jgi:hypothetical protein